MRTRGFLQAVAVTMVLAYGALPVHAGEYAARAEGEHEAAASGCGETWTARTPGTRQGLYGVGWTGHQFVVVGASGTVLTSPDGVTWTARTSGVTDPLWAMAWTGTLLVAVGENGTILTSPDAATWTRRTSGVTNHLYGVTWTGTTIVAGGYGSTILTSPDGITWTARATGDPLDLRGITLTGAQVVAVGDAACIFTSPDGIMWTRRTSYDASYNLFAVTWTGTQVVAVGTGGKILTSLDGIVWTSRTSGTSDDLHGVAGTGAQVVVVGVNGTILTSSDSVTWTPQASGTYPNLLGMGLAGSQLVAVGCCPGLIVTSPCSGSSYPYSTWVPVASHNAGKNNSQWRSDLGLLNIDSVTANAQITFFGSDALVSSTTYVPARTQSILTDVVGQLNGSNSGALEVLSDQPLKVTARTYNEVSSTASCYPGGTQGQDYPAVVTGDGLAAGSSAYLAGLTENASYRCNIGVVNTGTGSATVLVELFDGVGTKLVNYTVSLAAGQWAQETQPFKIKALQTAMDRGYAKVTVQTGSGVFGFASVIDNITNDPTTVTMQR